MNTQQYLALVSLSSLLTACGGGGSSSGAAQTTENTVKEPAKLVFEFAKAPLEPIAFNLSADRGEPDNHFDPGDTLNITWNVTLYKSDNSGLENKQYLYDAKVYLSRDFELQPEEDLEIIASECSMGVDYQHSCVFSGSFKCVYAPDNQNQMSCTSIPLGMPYGLKDYIVDMSAFLDTIPKSAVVIFKACLQGEPDVITIQNPLISAAVFNQ